MNAYPVAYRKKAVKAYEDSHRTLAEVALEFHISPTTLKSWRKLKRKTGQLKAAPPRRKSKISLEELRNYIERNPTEILENIAQHFHSSKSHIHRCLQKLGITRKKNGARLYRKG